MKDNWKTEIIRRLPYSATFLLASFLLFKYTDQELAAWICTVVAIIALFLVIKFEHYEKIIDRQEKQIKHYSQQAMDSQKGATKLLTDVNTSIASSLRNNGLYQENDDTPTEAS